MKLTNKTKRLGLALKFAKQTQWEYDQLGSPSTQRIRNPFPMHMLVQSVLPILPRPDAIVTLKTKCRTTVKGRKFAQSIILKQRADSVLPRSVWQQGMTAQQVCDSLVEKGFIANLGTVKQTLYACSSYGWVDSVSSTDRPGAGRPRSLYFFPDEKLTIGK